MAAVGALAVVRLPRDAGVLRRPVGGLILRGLRRRHFRRAGPRRPRRPCGPSSGGVLSPTRCGSTSSTAPTSCSGRTSPGGLPIKRPTARRSRRRCGSSRRCCRCSRTRPRSRTHLAVAFDNPIRSFRNELFDGYKTEEGVPEELLAQFDIAELATRALGITVWSMREFEADDALATGGGAVCLRGGAGADPHPGQGPRAVSPRRAGRPGRPDARQAHRRAGAARAARHRPGEHPRLARPGRRHRRRHPRAARLRREGRRGGAGRVRPPGADSRGRARLARVGPLARHAGAHARGAPGGRAPVPHPGDAAHRRAGGHARCRRSSTGASPASRSSSSRGRWTRRASSLA